MSIINSIANVRRPIGAGVTRSAYYSKKYDVVIKIDLENVCSARDESFESEYNQSSTEYDLFNSLTEKEKEIFPIVGIVHTKTKGVVVLMKRAKVVADIMSEVHRQSYKEFKLLYETMDNIRWHRKLKNSDCELLKKYGISVTSARNVVKFAKKYNIGDLHKGNLGVINGKLVIIDAGLPED